MKPSHLLWLLISLFCLFTGCDKERPDLEGYGLNWVELRIDHPEWSTMQSNAQLKNPYPAEILHSHGTHKGTVRFTGNSTLYHPKRSYEFHFKRQKFYGRSHYRFSAQAFDPSAMRSFMGFHVYEKLGFSVPRMAPITFYRNGKLQGLYYKIERVDGQFLHNAGIDAATMYKAKLSRLRHATFSSDSLNDLNTGFKIVIGEPGHHDLKQLIYAVNAPNSAENKKRLEQLLDVENYLRYLAGTVLLDHWDGFANNFFIYRSRNDQRFRFLPWDLDQVLTRGLNSDQIADVTEQSESVLVDKILSYPSYALRFSEIVFEVIEQLVPLSEAEQLLLEHQERIRQSFEADPTHTNLDIESERTQVLIQLRELYIWARRTFE